jgi:hypothetical protein
MEAFTMLVYAAANEGGLCMMLLPPSYCHMSSEDLHFLFLISLGTGHL